MEYYPPRRVSRIEPPKVSCISHHVTVKTMDSDEKRETQECKELLRSKGEPESWTTGLIATCLDLKLPTKQKSGEVEHGRESPGIPHLPWPEDRTSPVHILASIEGFFQTQSNTSGHI